jgi:hypothetical protein
MIMKETLQELGRSRIGSCYQEKKVKYTAKRGKIGFSQAGIQQGRDGKPTREV